MEKTEQTLVSALKAELEFLDEGRYARSPAGWKAPLIFEDSPVCPNYRQREKTVPCEECVLIQLVPPEFRDAQIPCRHIQLDESGENLDHLYRHAGLQDLHDTYRKWLVKTIAELEGRKMEICQAPITPRVEVHENILGVELHQALHPKCANPRCPVAFDWLAGGKFFRFQEGAQVKAISAMSLANPPSRHTLKHFWLCESCSTSFTLLYDAHDGVLLEPLWRELPEAISAT